jgi:hypothetical protein
MSDDSRSPIALATPDSTGKFQISAQSLPVETAFAVAGFHDENKNGSIDRGEDFLPARAVEGATRTKGLFLLTPAGAFIGDRARGFDRVQFEISPTAINR